MLVEILTCIGLVLAVLSAGISIGRLVEKINEYISKNKNNRHGQ